MTLINEKLKRSTKNNLSSISCSIRFFFSQICYDEKLYGSVKHMISSFERFKKICWSNWDHPTGTTRTKASYGEKEKKTTLHCREFFFEDDILLFIDTIVSFLGCHIFLLRKSLGFSINSVDKEILHLFVKILRGMLWEIFLTVMLGKWYDKIFKLQSIYS